MKIVDLNANDIDKILKLYSLYFDDGWNKNMLTGAFNFNRFFAIGLQEEDLVGVITYSLSDVDADIEGLVISKEYRNKGLALFLLSELEKRLKEKNVQKVFLEVRESNISAKNLYIKNGYQQINLRKKYYNDGENAIVMAKELI